MRIAVNSYYDFTFSFDYATHLSVIVINSGYPKTSCFSVGKPKHKIRNNDKNIVFPTQRFDDI